MEKKALYSIYYATKGVLAPSLEYAQHFYEEELVKHLATDRLWLDLGCGHQILSPWRQSEENELVSRCRDVFGTDVCFPALQAHRSIRKRVVGDIVNLPFNARSFDLVTANMVVEHLCDPLAQFCEIRRILKPRGCFVFHTPNAYGYFGIARRFIPWKLNVQLVRLLEGRSEEDIFPIQYKANTAARIHEIARQAGFRVNRIRMLLSEPVFAIVPPLMIVELSWIRLLMLTPFKRWRTNIIAELEAC